MSTANPLIASANQETVSNCAEALSAVVVLMADRHSDLCRLLFPILSALEHVSSSD